MTVPKAKPRPVKKIATKRRRPESRIVPHFFVAGTGIAANLHKQLPHCCNEDDWQAWFSFAVGFFLQVPERDIEQVKQAAAEMLPGIAKLLAIAGRYPPIPPTKPDIRAGGLH